MKTSEIRERFLNYFKELGHEIVSSSPIVPKSDPTLLFVNAGMNQFKDSFLGNETRSYKTATTSQKCLRVSGKHNDFENVGFTARHHTFFEMLGNFSFGDYFKKEAIKYAWDFITKELKLDKSKIWITIFEEDQEARKLWLENTDIINDRILDMGEKDCFWSMGDVGPCGPCSEIHYYVGNDPKNQSEKEFRKDDGTYLEFWNLVFMQFNRTKEGELIPLPNPSIDTGMGLERVASIMQNTKSNYETDLLRAIISKTEELSNIEYKERFISLEEAEKNSDALKDVAMRVIADHSRAIAFLIAEGIMPGSEGRSYVLRRIIRRAARHGRSLKFKKPFLKETTKIVIGKMSDIYPQLNEQKENILNIVDNEEKRFYETLDSGLKILTKETLGLERGGVFSGKIAFLLHDTYGFPLDLTEDVLRVKGISVNQKEFNQEMEKQKNRSRKDRKSHSINYESLNIASKETNFVGYDTNKTEATLLEIISFDNKLGLIFDKTPFYAESGGQIGDSGKVRLNQKEIDILDTQKINNVYLHICNTDDSLKNLIGEKANLIIDVNKRESIRSNHSATHLLHKALREVLGTHVHQAGSRVSEKDLRFDYTHLASPKQEELDKVQKLINEYIRKNFPIVIKEMSLDDAKANGAMALFGEKYGKVVRTVKMGDSFELCGGTHVNNSGDIDVCLISSESSISSGIRRIECTTKNVAKDKANKENSTLRKDLKTLLKEIEKEFSKFKNEEFKDKPIYIFDPVPNNILDIAKENNILKKDIDNLNQKLKQIIKEKKKLQEEKESLSLQEEIKKHSKIYKDIHYISFFSDNNTSINILKNLVDLSKNELKSGIVAIGGKQGEKANLVIGVTKDLKDKLDAGQIVKKIAKLSRGRGGGKQEFAQAGGLNIDDLKKYLKSFEQFLKGE